jgi:cation:H+ antiporter
MEIMTLLVFVISLIVLVAGAELLVNGASQLALSLRISPLVVGLTVVAYGTSAPELAVNLHSTLTNQSDLAIGNVIGSNISNILLVLGVAALASPLTVSKQLITFDVPFMIAVFLLFYGFAWDGTINFGESSILVALMLIYSIFSIVKGRTHTHARAKRLAAVPTTWRWTQFLLIISGLVLLVLGANGLVDAAVTIAKSLGISELLIGLTIVAVGTSIPELATSIIASLRGKRDIAVGNVIGSNIFNVLLVLGVTGLLAPTGISVPASALSSDIPIMLVAGIACLPIFITGYVISRLEGFLLLIYYLAYTSYLILHAIAHPLLPLFNQIMLVTIPVSFILFVGFAWRDMKRR